MNKILLTFLLLSTAPAFAQPELVSIASIGFYPSELGNIVHSATQLLANAAHAKCPTGVDNLTDINFHIANTDASVEKYRITIGYASLIATGLVTCK